MVSQNIMTNSDQCDISTQSGDASFSMVWKRILAINQKGCGESRDDFLSKFYEFQVNILNNLSPQSLSSCMLIASLRMQGVPDSEIEQLVSIYERNPANTLENASVEKLFPIVREKVSEKYFGTSVTSGDTFGETAFAARSFSGTCHNCHRKGHYAKDCPEPKTEEYKHRRNEALAKKKGSTTKPYGSAWVGFADRAELGPNGTQFPFLHSGCTVHVFRDRSLFKNYRPYDDERHLEGVGGHLRVHGTGTIEVRLEDGTPITMYDVAHVPDSEVDLISVPRAVDKGADFRFTKDRKVIYTDDSGRSRVISVRPEGGKLYPTRLVPVVNSTG